MIKQSCLTPAAVRVTMRLPFFTELFYSMEVIELRTKEEIEAANLMCPTICTNGLYIKVCRDWWLSRTLNDQVFILIHELLHKMLHHPTRCGTRDRQLFNIAADYVVNAFAKRQPGLKLPDDALYDAKYDDKTVEWVYNDLLQQCPPDDKGKADWIAEKFGKFGDEQQDLQEAGGTPEEREAIEQKVQGIVQRSIERAKAMGQLPVGMEMEAYKYESKKESWFNQLHRYLQSLNSTDYNWGRVDKRMLVTLGIVSPARQSESMDVLDFWIDASGSCMDKLIQSDFQGHCNNIIADVRPKKVRVGFWDTMVHKVVELDGVLEIDEKPIGGGGSSSKCVFSYLRKHNIRPEPLIIASDMMITYPTERPDFDVIWIDTSGHSKSSPPPFGRVIVIEQ